MQAGSDRAGKAVKDDRAPFRVETDVPRGKIRYRVLHQEVGELNELLFAVQSEEGFNPFQHIYAGLPVRLEGDLITGDINELQAQEGGAGSDLLIEVVMIDHGERGDYLLEQDIVEAGRLVIGVRHPGVRDGVVLLGAFVCVDIADGEGMLDSGAMQGYEGRSERVGGDSGDMHLRAGVILIGAELDDVFAGDQLKDFLIGAVGDEVKLFAGVPTSDEEVSHPLDGVIEDFKVVGRQGVVLNHEGTERLVVVDNVVMHTVGMGRQGCVHKLKSGVREIPLNGVGVGGRRGIRIGIGICHYSSLTFYIYYTIKIFLCQEWGGVSGMVWEGAGV